MRNAAFRGEVPCHTDVPSPTACRTACPSRSTLERLGSDDGAFYNQVLNHSTGARLHSRIVTHRFLVFFTTVCLVHNTSVPSSSACSEAEGIERRAGNSRHRRAKERVRTLHPSIHSSVDSCRLLRWLRTVASTHFANTLDAIFYLFSTPYKNLDRKLLIASPRS